MSVAVSVLSFICTSLIKAILGTFHDSRLIKSEMGLTRDRFPNNPSLRFRHDLAQYHTQTVYK